ncbi:membrane bound O-acyl transferase family-domain-containing protein [Leptodontidium sp. 2 PMI_412]|nr:membrane bound O-acyl transferase family-domain-containing protein [Leptodontidium sp. 2 PMI_412]
MEKQQMPAIFALLATPIFLTFAILLTTAPPGPLRVVVGIAIFALLWGYALSHWTAGPSLDSMVPIYTFSISLRFALLVVPGTPERDCLHLRRTCSRTCSPCSPTKHVRVRGEVDSISWRQCLTEHLHKLQWSILLWSSWRGLGWNYQDRHLRRGREQTRTRPKFLLAAACRATLNVLGMACLMKFVFCLCWPRAADDVVFLSLPMLQRHLTACILLVYTWLELDSTYQVASIMAVSLGLTPPDQWPPLFGRPADMYSVRNFWGRCWHQVFRDVFSRSSDLVVDILGIKKGALATKYIRLHVGFWTSGLLHYAVPLIIVSPKFGWGMFWAMPAYAAIITLEDFVLYCGNTLGIPDCYFVRGVGYVWTFYWITLVHHIVASYIADVGALNGICT